MRKGDRTNIRFYASGMKICPNDVKDDGIDDLCIVRNINRFQFVRSLCKVFNGKHVSDSGIFMMRAETITVQSKEPLAVHTDGECYESTPIKIKVQRLALNVL